MADPKTQPIPDTRQMFETWEQVLHQFRGACGGPNPPTIGQIRDYLKPVPPERYADVLVDLACEHLRHSWQVGTRHLVEDYLPEFPTEFIEVPVELIKAEFLARHEFPSDPATSIADYERRFPNRPDCADELRSRCLDGDRYVLLRRQGQGGLGRVWLAHDRHLRRRVAIKEPLPGLVDDDRALRRLAEEARVTAGLDHPSIVNVHEFQLGAQETPFYVMRLVQGLPLNEVIAEYYRNGPSTPAGRLLGNRLLQSFVSVCDALAYAHARGVLHRDLKPHNIMLGDYGETVVLDWGLTASVGTAAQQPRSESGAAGTPAYMAPEQLRGVADARTDVFGLGAVLYQILTDRSPYHDAVGDQLLELVREARFVPPCRVNRSAPKPLDAVCRKALAADPQQRYDSAANLGDEVRRYLADERVTAYREPALARSRRWARRHRSVTLAIGTLLVSALVFLSILVVVLERSRTRLELARIRTDHKYREARSAVDYFAEVSEKDLAGISGTQRIRDQMLENALKYYEGFLAEHGDDATLAPEVARTCVRIASLSAQRGDRPRALAMLDRAIPQLEALVRDRPDDLDLHLALAGALSNKANLLEDNARVDEALDLYERGVHRLEQLIERHPSAAELRRQLATNHNNIGVLHRKQGRWAPARAAYEQALRLRQGLAETEPSRPELHDEVASSLLNIGLLDTAEGNWTAAAARQRQARDIRAAIVRDHGGHPEISEFRAKLANSQIQLAKTLVAAGDMDDALVSAQQARDLLLRAARDNPDLVAFRHRLITAHKLIGEIHLRLDHGDEALASYRLAEKGLRELLAIDPENHDYRLDLAGVEGTIGRLHMDAGRQRDAVACLQESHDLLAGLVRDGDARPRVVEDLATSLEYLGHMGSLPRKDNETAEVFEHRLKQAEGWYTQSCDHRRQLADRHPDGPAELTGLGNAYQNLASVSQQRQNLAKAVEYLRLAVQARQRLVDRQPANPQVRLDLADSHIGLAGVTMLSGDRATAGPACSDALALLKDLCKEKRSGQTFRLDLADALLRAADCLKQLDRTDDELAAWRLAIEEYRRVYLGSPSRANSRNALSKRLEQFAARLRDRKRPTEALAIPDERLRLWPDDAGEAYQAACEFAACIPLQADSTAIVEKAISALRQALVRDPKLVARLPKDSTLDPLRSHIEFQKLTTEIEQSKPK